MDNSEENIEVVKLFQEVAILLKRNMHKVYENAEMTLPKGMIMGILSKYNKIKISELSRKVGLSNSTVSGIIDRLENEGIVERERSEEDKRVVYVSVTKKCEEMHRNFHEKAKENIENLMKRGTKEELEKITDSLAILKRLLISEETELKEKKK